MSNELGAIFDRIGFVGAGRTATALALGMSRAGYTVAAVASRSPASAQTLAVKLEGCRAVEKPISLVALCDLVFLTVPDDAIASVAAALPWNRGQGAVHCSGALTLEALASAGERGALVGSLHPLQTFAGAGGAGARRLKGSAFAVEAQEPLLAWLLEAVGRLGGRAVQVEAAGRPLYHASAVMACGYVTTMLDAACQLWEAMGFSQQEALAALLPLARGTLANLDSLGTAKGATGPIIRGDLETIRLHLESISARAPGALPLYCQAGLATIALAVKRGAIASEQAQGISRLLRSYLAPSAQGSLSPGRAAKEAIL